MKTGILLILTVLAFESFSQNSLADRIYFGGGGGLSLGSDFTNVSVFPQVGYRITDPYSAGVGLVYQYVRLGNPVNESLNNYGWSVFNRYNILQ